MATLHGEPLNEGDRVYHLRYGYLEAVNQKDSYFHIVTPEGVETPVTAQGQIYGGMTMVYWHDPVIVAPAKDALVWAKIKVISQAAARAL